MPILFVKSNSMIFTISFTYVTSLDWWHSKTFSLFRDIAHHATASAKARMLNGISQSAASQQMQELERQLGITLLDRATRPLTLTPAGKLYLEYCRDAFRRRDEFEAELHRLKHDTQGKVHIAAIYSVAFRRCRILKPAFRRASRSGELVVSYLRPEKVFEAVQEDRADLGLVSYAESTRDVVALPGGKKKWLWPSRPQTSACRSMVRSPPRSLEGQSFVGFDEDLPIQQDIDRYLASTGSASRLCSGSTICR